MKRSLIAAVLFSGVMAEATIPVIAAAQTKRPQQAAVALERIGEPEPPLSVPWAALQAAR